jgi:hypothetical protein
MTHLYKKFMFNWFKFSFPKRLFELFTAPTVMNNQYTYGQL